MCPGRMIDLIDALSYIDLRIKTDFLLRPHPRHGEDIPLFDKRFGVL
jgi:hypothetical protein